MITVKYFVSNVIEHSNKYGINDYKKINKLNKKSQDNKRWQ